MHIMCSSKYPSLNNSGIVGDDVSYFSWNGYRLSESYVPINLELLKGTQTTQATINGTLAQIWYGCLHYGNGNETHESGVTKCTTGEAWSAFSWQHSSVFHCQWTHNQVFLLLSHMLIWNAKSLFIYVMKYVSVFIWKLGINFAVFIKWIDETWWNNRLLLVPNCYEVVAMVATMVAMVAPLWCHTLR